MEENALSSLRADLQLLSKVASGLWFTSVQSQPRNCRPKLSSSSSSLSDDQETGTGDVGISNDDAGTTTTPPCDSDNDDDVNEEAPPFEDYDEVNEEALFSSSSENDEDEMDNRRVAEDELDFEADDYPEKILPGPRNTRTRSSSSGSAVQVLPTPTATPSSTSLIRNKNRRRKTFKARTKVFLLPSSSEDSSIEDFEEEEDINFYDTFAITNEETAAQRRSDEEGHEQSVTPTYNIEKLNGKKKILRTGITRQSRAYLLPSSSSSSSSDNDSSKPEEDFIKKSIQFGASPKTNTVNNTVEDELSTFNNSDSVESLLQESEHLKTKGTKKRTSVIKAISSSDSSSSESDGSDSESDSSSSSEDESNEAIAKSRRGKRESNEISFDEVIAKPRKGERDNLDIHKKNTHSSASQDEQKYRTKFRGNIYRCPTPTCGKTFNTKRSYIYHRQSELGTSGFICEEAGCGKTFPNHVELSAHKKKAHPSSTPVKYKKGTVLRCKICSKGFYKRWDLKRHAAVHGIGNYVCKHCGKVFSIEFYLKAHLKMHDKRDLGTSGFICEDVGCGEMFSSHVDLSAHKKQAHPLTKDKQQSTEFRCNICRTYFYNRFTLERHAATHGIGKYFCKLCGKVFSVESRLKSHLKMHD